jgi:hypothetical protein
MTLYLEWTPGNTYLKLIRNIGDRRNLGIISPNDGQISVKPFFEENIKNAVKKKFDIQSGSGRHSGSGYEFHTTNTLTVHEVVGFLNSIQNFELQYDQNIADFIISTKRN